MNLFFFSTRVVDRKGHRIISAVCTMINFWAKTYHLIGTTNTSTTSAVDLVLASECERESTWGKHMNGAVAVRLVYVVFNRLDFFHTFIFNSTFYAANKSDVQKLITLFVWKKKSEFLNVIAHTVIDFKSRVLAVLLHCTHNAIKNGLFCERAYERCWYAICREHHAHRLQWYNGTHSTGAKGVLMK